MAFIDKKNPVVINIMLTSKGRELLSTGGLTFDYYAIGDSEMDYEYNRNAVLATSGNTNPFDAFNASILRPKDKNASQLSFIPQTLSGDPYNEIPTISPASYDVVNPVSAIGFFTSGATEFLTDSNHVKQPDCMIEMSGVTGGTTVRLYQAPGYGVSGEEPAVGDLLLVKWTMNESTTGHTINKDYPSPYLNV
jgi:hypothetical protein